MNSYRKGANSERELAEELTRLLGVEFRRMARPFLFGRTNPDVWGTDQLHVESKRREGVNLSAALRQAQRDAGGALPVVCHRSNRQPWVASVLLSDLPKLARIVHALGHSQKGLP